MASTTTTTKTDPSRGARRYARHTEHMRLLTAISYYRSRRNSGEERWEPKPYSKLHAWASKHGLDASKLVTGEQTLPRQRRRRRCQTSDSDDGDKP